MPEDAERLLANDMKKESSSHLAELLLPREAEVLSLVPSSLKISQV